MEKIVIALFSAGPNSIVEPAEDGNGHVFVDYCGWGHDAYLPGDKVPPHWVVKPYAVVLDDEAKRSGYETGLANKPDPNPYSENSAYYFMWRTGYRLGEWQRKQYDKEQDKFMAEISANIK